VKLLNKPRVFKWIEGELVQVPQTDKPKLLAKLASLLEEETYCASCLTRLTENKVALAFFSDDNVLGWCSECAEKEILELLIEAFSVPSSLEAFSDI